MEDALGKRMKEFYEEISRNYLTRRVPVIIRLDGKAFHTFTRGMNRPFDEVLSHSMLRTAIELVKQVQGCKLAYVQSDEISLLLTDWDTLDTDAWFAYAVQKVVSVSASIATLEFNKAFYNKVKYDCSEPEKYTEKLWNALFDARAFNVPKEDVVNYFWWRQSDAIRNSTTMIAQSYFSHKELQNKSTSDINLMLEENDINVNNYYAHYRRGAVVLREKDKFTERTIVRADFDVPLFHKEWDYIGKYLV